MDKCFVNVCGGIGNQLFQIANGFAYSQKHNKQLLINAIGWSAGQGTHPDNYKDTIFKNFEYVVDAPKTTWRAISEKRFNYDELPYANGDVSLSGYFQSLKYFEKYAEDFEMMLDIDITDSYDVTSLCTGVHVRRGDYLGYSKHNICNRKYFEDAFDYLGVGDTQIHIYTDSPEYVAKEFEGSTRNMAIVDEKDDVKCLTHLSSYDNLICSNSSFSWWAAFLGRYNENIIVPDRWFNDFEDHEDIYIDRFTKIEVC